MMNSPMKFTPGELWLFNGKALRFEREIAGGLLHFQVERTLLPFHLEGPNGPIVPGWRWALTEFAAGHLIRPREPSGSRGRQLAMAREYDPSAIEQLDPNAKLRIFVLRGLDAAGPLPRTRNEIRESLRRLWADRAEEASKFARQPSTRSVQRWLADRGEPGDRRLAQMLSMTGRVPRAKHLPAVIHALVDRFALRYWSRRGWHQADAYAALSDLIEYINCRRERSGKRPSSLKLPSRETFRLRIRALECYETYAAKYGKKKAASRFKANGKGLVAARILRLGCMDHTLLDGVAVIDAKWMLPLGRPWLTVIIDVRSRCIVGFVLTYEQPSLYAVTECLKRANRPKVHILEGERRYHGFANIFGRFDEIVVDNGWELVGTAFEDALADIGTSVRWAPVASPTYKANVERFFGTLNTLLNQKLPGATVKPELLRELGYDPYMEAVLTVEELEELIWDAICFYHLDEHDGLGMPPGLVWKRDAEAYGIDVIGDETQLDKMLGAMRVNCQLSRSGVEAFGLIFHDPAKVGPLLEDLAPLEPVRSRRKSGSATAKVKIKYNPANLAEVHVWNHRRKRYVSLPCADEEYADGISLFHHNALRKWASEAGLAFSSEADRLKARAQLSRKIDALAPELKIRQRRAMARLMKSPVVQDRIEGVVELGYAPARHDGLAPVIEAIPLAFERSDAGQPSNRPARNKTKRQSKAAAKPVSEIEKDDWTPNLVPTREWKGFE